MDRSVSGFEWDDGNRGKRQKHGVSVVEIESLFSGTLAVFPDPVHSQAEERFKAIGRTAAGRYTLIVFTLRKRDGTTNIRPISARYMHRKEVEHYEATVTRPEQ